MNSKNITPVILCGGSGTRLWPLSRKSFPKQFLSLGENENRTLLQKTQERILDIQNINPPILVCNEEHRFIVAEQMRQINIKPRKILLEPFGRNTAPAIALAALTIIEDFKDSNLLVLSADHEIIDTKKFIEVIHKGLVYSESNRLVTFGVIPNSAETGYGYIESKNRYDDLKVDGSKIIKFIEKPDLETANKLIKDKHYTWNSGIFLFKAKLILEEIKKFQPEIYTLCKESLKGKKLDFDFQRINKNIFKNCPRISIDKAVMEKTSLGTVLPLNAGWSDIGSWDAVWNISKKDSSGNVLRGEVVQKNCFDSYLKSDHRLLVGLGIKNIIAIETSDAVLIADKKQSQDVKNIVEKLHKDGQSSSTEHKKIYRPWGHYISIAENYTWKVKMIFVKNGERLSLQKHNHRSEHWVVVEGIATVEIDQTIKKLYKNESAFIPKGSMHRLSNFDKSSLILIEVQTGTYLGEDDIIRFDDNYGRI